MASILITVLIVVFLFFPLMTYIIFWYDTGNSSYRDELAKESGGKITSWILRGFLSSILSHIIIISSFPLAFVKSLWQPTLSDNTSSPPVILIHGLYHNASAWIFYRRWLRRAGYQRVYLFNYNSLKSTFWEISSQLDKMDVRNSPLLSRRGRIDDRAQLRRSPCKGIRRKKGWGSGAGGQSTRHIGIPHTKGSQDGRLRDRGDWRKAWPMGRYSDGGVRTG